MILLATREAEELILWAHHRHLKLIELQAEHLLMMAEKQFTHSHAKRIQALAERVDAPISAYLVEHAVEMAQEKSLNPFGKSARLLARQGFWVPGETDFSPLTGREREVARLSAIGFSRRSIAEMLNISKRTVDSHLNRIFMKYHITAQDELYGIL